MKKSLITLATLAAAELFSFPAATGADETILKSEGWIIDAQGGSGQLTIQHERLGN